MTYGAELLGAELGRRCGFLGVRLEKIAFL